MDASIAALICDAASKYHSDESLARDDLGIVLHVVRYFSDMKGRCAPRNGSQQS